MPLTPAEKMKRYRERLKKDPEKYDEYKKKDLLRIKLKKKKIQELSETEKEAQRKIWREQKRKSKKKNCKKPETSIQISTPASNPSLDTKTKKSISKLRKNANKWRRTCYAMKEKNLLLQKKIEMLRKRHYRINKENSKLIKRLEEHVTKMQIRQEVLESALKSAYNETKTLKEKQSLKNLAKDKAAQKKNVKKYMGKVLGLKGWLRTRSRCEKVQNINIMKEIEAFYLRDDISRCTSGKKECRTLHKEKKQIRYLTDTVFNLHKIYKQEGGKYSFGTFYKYKPYYILSPSVKNRDTCLCIKHSNMEMLFTALAKNGVFPNNIKSLSDVMSKLLCNVKSFDCMNGKCKTCKDKVIQYVIDENCFEKRVQWCQWERADHAYSKAENGKLTEVVTKKTVKKFKNNTIRELIKNFETKIKTFQVHFFNWQHQQRLYRQKILSLGPDEAMILCDFSENYECKLSSEVQAIHFGASKQQITLHCGMIFWSNGSQSFCTLSDNKCHEPSAIWAHLTPILDIIKKTTPQIKTIHFFSDGPSSQYRQKKNFFLLNKFTTKHNLDFCTWNFSESGHGKGVADGIGGTVKRTLDKQVAYGHDITNSRDAFDLLISVSKTIKYFLIQDSDINPITKMIPKDLRAVPGTMQIHQIVSQVNTNYILHRVLTCFCSQDKLCVCDCFPLTKHTFGNKSIKQSAAKKVSRKWSANSKNGDSYVETIESLNVCPTASSSVENYSVLPKTSEACSDQISIPLDLTDLVELKSSDVDSYFNETYLLNNLTYDENDGYELTNAVHIDQTITETIKQVSVLNATLSETTSNIILPKKRLREKSDSKITSDENEMYKRPIKQVSIFNATMSESTSNTKTLPEKRLQKRSDSKITCIENVMYESSATCKKNTKRKIMGYEKEDNSSRKNPSIRTIISRNIQCFSCEKSLPFASNNLSKCMMCKKWFCVDRLADGECLCRACYGAKY